MHKKGTILLVISLILLGLVSVNIFLNYNNREGKVFISSESIVDLQKRIPFLSSDSISISSCKWYEQIRKKDGIFFIITYLCYDGKLVLEDDYFRTIVSKYKWEEYTYPTSPKEEINEDFYGEREIYSSSMINDSLRTKKLYTCDEYNRSFDSGTYYTFLDKESKTLYFYYLLL